MVTKWVEKTDEALGCARLHGRVRYRRVDHLNLKSTYQWIIEKKNDSEWKRSVRSVVYISKIVEQHISIKWAELLMG